VTRARAASPFAAYAIQLCHPTQTAEIWSPVLGFLRDGRSAHVRDSIRHQATGRVLQTVATRHNLAFLIPSLRTKLFDPGAERRVPFPAINRLLGTANPLGNLIDRKFAGLDQFGRRLPGWVPLGRSSSAARWWALEVRQHSTVLLNIVRHCRVPGGLAHGPL
jgi:hypothetical protein